MQRIRDVLLVLLILACAVVYIGNGSPRFWGDFTGMTEAEVREGLGAPFRDSRENNEDVGSTYQLGWYQGFSVALVLEFEDGVVVSKKRYSR